MSLASLYCEWKAANRFRALPAEQRQIVFYAEDGGSYTHYEAILHELTEVRGRDVAYLTSSPDDPILRTTTRAFDREAVRWTRLAADQGHAIAQSSLAGMYANGEGVPQDYTEAHKWINLAASRATGDDQQRDAERRDTLAKEMTPAQVDEAQRLATEWQETFDAGIVYPYIVRQE